MADRTLPAPTPSPETEKFWAAARDGKLMLPRCTSCGRLHWYPRAVCPFCFADISDWVEASGEGTIYTYSVMRRADPPYAIAYVALAEGPKILTNIVGADLDDLRIGQAVSLRWTATDGGPPVPTFAPK